MKNLIKASAALMSLSLFGCFNAQPTPPCAVGHGGYAAQLVKLTGPATGTCVRNADIIGVQKYRQEDGTQDIYLKPESISAFQYLSGVPPLGGDYTSLSIGDLPANEPNAEGFCTVPSLTPATGATFAGFDGNGDAVPGPELTYTFSNVDFYVQGSTAGTQFRADLTIADNAGGCTATYEVRAMYPVIFCNDLREEGDINTPREQNCSEVDHVWSGVSVNPLFATTCTQYGNLELAPDYDYALTGATPWHICVPATEIPSLK